MMMETQPKTGCTPITRQGSVARQGRLWNHDDDDMKLNHDILHLKDIHKETVSITVVEKKKVMPQEIRPHNELADLRGPNLLCINGKPLWKRVGWPRSGAVPSFFGCGTVRPKGMYG